MCVAYNAMLIGMYYFYDDNRKHEVKEVVTFTPLELAFVTLRNYICNTHVDVQCANMQAYYVCLLVAHADICIV